MEGTCREDMIPTQHSRLRGRSCAAVPQSIRPYSVEHVWFAWTMT